MSENVTTSTTTIHNRRSANQFWPRLMIALISCVLASQFTGCLTPPGKLETDKIFEKGIGSYRDKVWAKRAYNLRYANCEREYGNHFRDGFVDGYCSVCRGDKGYVPAMPPEDYWSPQYQVPEGAKCVNAWFEGFPVGAEAAKKDGAGKFHDIYISNMVNSAVVQDKQAKALKSPRKTVPIIAPPAPRAEMPQAMMPPILPAPTASVDNSAPAVIDTTVDSRAPLPMNGLQPASYETMIGNQQ